MHANVNQAILDVALKTLPLCPKNAFVSLNKTDVLKGKLPKSSRLNIVAFRCEETVAKTAPLSVDPEPLNVSVLNIYSAKSSGLLFGYIMAAYSPIVFHSNYIGVTAVKESQYAECNLSFQDKYLSVISSPSGSCLVVSNIITLFDTSIIRLRRTK